MTVSSPISSNNPINPINPDVIKQSFNRQFFPLVLQFSGSQEVLDHVSQGIGRAIQEFNANDCTTTQKVIERAEEYLQPYLPEGEGERTPENLYALNAISVLSRLMRSFKEDTPAGQFLKAFIAKIPEDIQADVIIRLNNSTHEGRGVSNSDVIGIVLSNMRECRKAHLAEKQTYYAIVKDLKDYATKERNIASRPAVASAIEILRDMYGITDSGHDLPLTRTSVEALHNEFIDRFVKTIPDHIRPFVVRGINGDWSHGKGKSCRDILENLEVVFEAAKEHCGTKQAIKGAALSRLDGYMDDPFNEGSQGAVDSARAVLDEVLYTQLRQEIPLQEGNSYGCAVVFSPHGQVDTESYERVLYDGQVQTMAPRKLSDQADEMRPHILSWLEQMGIVPVFQTGRNILGFRNPPPENPDNGDHKEAGMNLSNHKHIDDDAIYSIGAFHMSGREIKRMFDETHVTFVNGGPINRRNVHQDVGQQGTENFSNSQFVLVSGPVLIPFNNMNESIARDPETTPMVQAYSIPGINLNYSASDQAAFAKEDTMEVNDAGRLRMRQIVGHVFEKMKQDNVKQPIMSAIGCGAFKLPVDGGRDAPRAMAQAMYDCLANNDYGFEKVWISIPVFDDPTNNETFIATFNQLMQEKPLKCPVAIANASMLSLAETITRNEPNSKVGILNPSDAQAVREGKIAMYWNHGHIALEELLGLYTTMLLQQVALRHKGAYKRAKGIDLPADIAPR